MGCGGSKNLTLLQQLRERFPKTLSILELQDYSKTLAELFLAHDTSGTMTLSLTNFLTMCRLPRNRISERIFALCDMDGTGTLDFRELCFAVWQVCTLDARGLTIMLFDLYDEYNDGGIEADDITRLLGDSYGLLNLNMEEMQELIGFVKSKGTLRRGDFVRFCERTPQVLKQMIDVQRSMRLYVLGIPAWHLLTKRRQSKTDPIFSPDNWSSLMEKLILMDIDSRAEQERLTKALEKKLGRRIRRKKLGSPIVGVSRRTRLADVAPGDVKYEN